MRTRALHAIFLEERIDAGTHHGNCKCRRKIDEIKLPAALARERRIPPLHLPHRNEHLNRKKQSHDLDPDAKDQRKAPEELNGSDDEHPKLSRPEPDRIKPPGRTRKIFEERSEERRVGEEGRSRW